MTFILEHLGERKEKSNGRPYRSFWILLVHEGISVTIKSCLYHIDTGTIQMPFFGAGIPLIHLDPLTYRELEKHVRETFLSLGESKPTVTDEERRATQTKVRKKLRKGKK